MDSSLCQIGQSGGNLCQTGSPCVLNKPWQNVVTVLRTLGEIVLVVCQTIGSCPMLALGRRAFLVEMQKQRKDWSDYHSNVQREQSINSQCAISHLKEARMLGMATHHMHIQTIVVVDPLLDCV